MSLWTGVVVAISAFALMEPLTAATHRWLMHGIGHRLHRSHHRRARPGESPRRWEANDAFPVLFAALVMLGFAVGFNVARFAALVPMGIGVTMYGITYALVHDVYIHRRLPLFGDRRIPGLEQLAAAHREHHRCNAAPYGMLAPRRSRTLSPTGVRPARAVGERTAA